MLSVRGPRSCAITFASTSIPSTAGLPTFTPSESLKSRTRPSFTEAPGSAPIRSTRIRSPAATRYCLPPLTTTAEAFVGASEPSGLGTASDCTKRQLEACLVDDQVAAQQDRLDQPQRRQRRDRGRAAVRYGGSATIATLA